MNGGCCSWRQEERLAIQEFYSKHPVGLGGTGEPAFTWKVAGKPAREWANDGFLYLSRCCALVQRLQSFQQQKVLKSQVLVT